MQQSQQQSYALHEERVLLLAGNGADNDAISEMLRAETITTEPCSNLIELTHLIEEGAGAAIISEEHFHAPHLQTLLDTLQDQAEWSDLPIIIITLPEPESRLDWTTLRGLTPIHQVTLLERPLSRLTLVSATQVALRARRRQYETRTHLEELKRRQHRVLELVRREKHRKGDLETIFQVAPIGIAVTHDAEGKFLTVNPAAADLLGVEAGVVYEAAALTSMGLCYADEGASRAGGDHPFTCVADGRRMTNEEIAVRVPDGRVVTLLVNGAPLYDEQGHIRGGVTLFVDLTFRKKSEAALQESEARFRTLAETIPHIVWTSLPDGTIDFVNSRVTELDGIGDESMHTGWLQHVFHEDDDATRRAWRQAVASGEEFGLEHRIVTREHGVRWVVSRAVPLRDARGVITKWFGTTTDIHEQKIVQQERAALLQQARAARDEALRVSRMKDEFLSTLSHEIRTPLTAIRGWVTMIRRGNLSEQRLNEAFEAIDNNSLVQQALIEDLLDMSRIVSGRLKLELNDILLIEPVEAALQTVRPHAESKGVALEVHFDATDTVIHADAHRIQQACWNLLRNAVKFTPAGGRIITRVQAEDGVAEVVIVDNGIGIQADFIGHVFEQFRQADSSKSRRFEGLGLGLAIAKELVELHNGEILVASDGKDQGTTFRLRLPRVADADDQAPSSSTTSSRV